MPEQLHAQDLGRTPNRRTYPRQQVRSLSYIDLGDRNGGIVLNLSEGGLALQAVTSLMEEHLPRIRFQLSESRNWLETSGRVSWTSESRKVVGIEFVNLSDTARGQIKEWIASGDSPPELRAPETAVPAEKVTVPPATDSVLLMPVPAHPIAIAQSKDQFRASSNPVQPAPVLTDSESTAFSPVATKASKSSWTLNPPEPEPHHRLVILFVLLAVVSLIIGWAAGKAGLAQIFKRVKVTNASVAPSLGATVPPTVSTGAKISEIEIQDTNNNIRMIPFDGPPAASIARGTGQHSASGKKAFQVWVLSPPVRPQGATSLSSEENDNPPALTTVPANSTNILPSSSTLESRNAISALPPPPPPQKTHVGDLRQGRLIRRVEPLYPSSALADGVEGTVKLHAVIGDDGSIKTLESVSGPDLLIDSAMNAVRQWRYTPTLLDGKPIETDQDILIVFRLPAK